MQKTPEALAPPRCPSCEGEMRLVGCAPHERYTTLDYKTFLCDCGATTRDVVARMD